MKLLLENWRKYLNEDEAEHFPWLKDLRGLGAEPGLADRLRVRLQSGDDRFNILGAGAYRTVWSPRGDEDHVIKVVHDNNQRELQMNKDDFETAKRYPLIFPKGICACGRFFLDCDGKHTSNHLAKSNAESFGSIFSQRAGGFIKSRR